MTRGRWILGILLLVSVIQQWMAFHALLRQTSSSTSSTISTNTTTNNNLRQTSSSTSSTISTNTTTNNNLRQTSSSTSSTISTNTTTNNNLRQTSSSTSSTTTNNNNDTNVTHVVWTRFQQHQGHLEHLGRARLLLWKAICWPTLKDHTDYLWIILVDPNLHWQLREELLATVQQQSHVILLATNESPEVDSFRVYNIHQPIWYGSRSLLKAYQTSSQSNILVESNVDADDGVSRDWAAVLQQHALQHHQHSTIYCVGQHWEWHTGVWTVNDGRDHCVTTGLSWVSRNPTVRSFPYVRRHWFLQRELPHCNNDTKEECWQYLPTACAIRARTLTSAGMKNIQVTATNSLPPDRFGIAPLDDVAAHLVAAAPRLAQDALDGQCTPGHSCKPAAAQNLARIIHETSN